MSKHIILFCIGLFIASVMVIAFVVSIMTGSLEGFLILCWISSVMFLIYKVWTTPAFPKEEK